MTMSISPAPEATASAASRAFTSGRCLPDGKPATAATRTPALFAFGHHRRRDADRADAQRRGFGRDRGHLSGGGLGLEQGVVDERRHLSAGRSAGHQNALRTPPGLHPEPTIVVSSTTGRHGSRFQLALPGCRTSANSQWQQKLLTHARGAGIRRQREHLRPRLVGVGPCRSEGFGGRTPGRRRIDPQAGQLIPLGPLAT